jgi:hypothetical protein
MRQARGQFGDLRYVCRTLHAEFSPIYLTRTTVALEVSRIEHYLCAFYSMAREPKPFNETIVPSISSSKIMTWNTRGNIQIKIRHTQVLDLSPLISLISRLPRMCIEIVSERILNTTVNDINELLRTVADGSCSFDFECTLERILFRCSMRPELVIKLRRDASLDYIPGDTSDHNPRHWLVQQGAPVMSNITIVMESSQGVLRDPLKLPDLGSILEDPRTNWSQALDAIELYNRYMRPHTRQYY